MSMLADPRRKQKISIDPRNLAWKNDNNKFGKKLMEKMGWNEGDGLGVNGHGNVDAIKVSLKQDNRGVGCTRNYADNWIAHQDSFNDLLANLNANTVTSANDDASGYSSNPESQRLQRLEEKSKSSRGRLHYMKFAKGKDLSVKSKEELDCVFGNRKSKSAPSTPQTQSEANSDDDKEEVEQVTSSTIPTFTSSTSVQAYFANKLAAMRRMQSGTAEQQPQQLEDRSDLESPPRAGFGFSQIDRSQQERTHEHVPLCNMASSIQEESNTGNQIQTWKETMSAVVGHDSQECESKESHPVKSKRKKKHKQEKGEAEAKEYIKEEAASVEIHKKPKKKKRSKEKDNEPTPSLEGIDNDTDDFPKKRKKNKKSQGTVAFERHEEIEQNSNSDTCESSRKKRKRNFKVDAASQEVRADDNEQPNTEISKKKKRKKKKAEGKDDGYEEEIPEQGENEGHSGKGNLAQRLEVSEKRVKKRKHKKVDKDDLEDDSSPETSSRTDQEVVNLFSGSNFAQIKGYGHQYDQSLTVRPITKKRTQETSAIFNEMKK